MAYVDGGHERQKLDLYLPRVEGVRPLLVWIHGGAWLGGSKDAPPVLSLALRHGFAVASLNYRLSQHAPFPAQLEAFLFRYLRPVPSPSEAPNKAP